MVKLESDVGPRKTRTSSSLELRPHVICRLTPSHAFPVEAWALLTRKRQSVNSRLPSDLPTLTKLDAARLPQDRKVSSSCLCRFGTCCPAIGGARCGIWRTRDGRNGWMEAAFRGCITALTIPWSQMKDVLKTEELELPEGVEVTIKSRQITVKGPRGTLTKNVRHIDMDIRLITGKTNKVTLAVWQGGRKHVACLRTIKSLIENMVTGVTKVRSLTGYAHGVELTSHRTIGLPVQDACRICPFPYQLHHSGQREGS